MEYREKCAEYMARVLGYDRKHLIHSFFFSKLEELNKIWGYELIYKTLESSEKEIIWALEEKSFTSEKNVISYVMGIIKNRIGDTARAEQAEERAKRGGDKFTLIDQKIMSEFENRKPRTQDVKDITKYL